MMESVDRFFVVLGIHQVQRGDRSFMGEKDFIIGR
jgi:hypothetical protein